ncbi:MAG: hypothetical protein M0Z75_04395, partial [Nitrospiraceae bacterium]|nr:hypothetical protein [Nitrospiraceae bacterium]
HDMEDLAMMSHKELRELITNLRQNRDPEKEKLKKEIKNLKKHNANLQASIPERPDSDWAQDYLAELEHQFEMVEELLRVFMLDERMLEPDREQVHSAAEGMFQRLNARLDSLRTKWHQFSGQDGRAR